MHATWKTRGVVLLDDASPLWSVLYLSALRRRRHHPSLSLLILFSHSPPDRQLVFWFTPFMFPDLCTHRPSPGFALWHSPAKTHKTNFNITCSQHIKKCHRSETSFSPPPLALSLLLPLGLGLLLLGVSYSASWFKKRVCEIAGVWSS